MSTSPIKSDSAFWQLPVTALFAQLAASPEGLSRVEAVARLHRAIAQRLSGRRIEVASHDVQALAPGELGDVLGDVDADCLDAACGQRLEENAVVAADFHHPPKIEGKFTMGHNAWVGEQAFLDSTSELTIDNGFRAGLRACVWSHAASAEQIGKVKLQSLKKQLGVVQVPAHHGSVERIHNTLDLLRSRGAEAAAMLSVQLHYMPGRGSHCQNFPAGVQIQESDPQVQSRAALAMVRPSHFESRMIAST